MTQKIDDKLLRRLADGREYRAMQLTADDGEQMRVEGFAATFGQPYTLYEDEDFRFDEIVDARAFDDTDLSDVILQYDHAGRVFARTSNGSLALTPTEHGLRVSADLSGTEIGRQLYQEIKGGYTTKMSFGFRVGADRREEATDYETGKTVVTRTITAIAKLYDVSAVSLPANDATSISARGYADGVISEIRAERLERAKKKLRLLLEV